MKAHYCMGQKIGCRNGSAIRNTTLLQLDRGHQGTDNVRGYRQREGKDTRIQGQKERVDPGTTSTRQCSREAFDSTWSTSSTSVILCFSLSCTLFAARTSCLCDTLDVGLKRGKITALRIAIIRKSNNFNSKIFNFFHWRLL